MKEISKAENVWEKNGYKLKYIHFTTFGSLNDFGKFLYFVNKSKKYIDTTRSYIELTQEAYKISLGYIENTAKQRMDKNYKFQRIELREVKRERE